ncbi:MAG: hypothetical protein ACLUD0_05460 [Eubacterium ramulus]
MVKIVKGAYISMGLTAENVARKYEISRREMDEMAVESHRRARQGTGQRLSEYVHYSGYRKRAAGWKYDCCNLGMRGIRRGDDIGKKCLYR